MLETIGDWLAKVDWGTLAAIVSAFVALGLLGYTAVTHRRAVSIQRRAQAALVAVWPPAWKFTHNSTYHGYEPFDAVVHNGSDQPIYAIRVELLPIDWREEPTPNATQVMPIVTPQSKSRPLPFPGLPGRMVKDQNVPAPPPLRLVFRDNAGVSWVRQPDGRLIEGNEKS